MTSGRRIRIRRAVNRKPRDRYACLRRAFCGSASERVVFGESTPEACVPQEQLMISDIFTHLNSEELLAGLDHIRCSPKAEGVVELIVRRQAINEREVLEQAELDLVQGLVGDTWN